MKTIQKQKYSFPFILLLSLATSLYGVKRKREEKTSYSPHQKVKLTHDLKMSGTHQQIAETLININNEENNQQFPIKLFFKMNISHLSNQNFHQALQRITEECSDETRSRVYEIIVRLQNIWKFPTHLFYFINKNGEKTITFPNLEKLDISLNRFDCPLPQELGYLTNLRSLNIKYSQIQGPIHPHLAKLRKLAHLKISHNELSEKDKKDLKTYLPITCFIEDDNNTPFIPHPLQLLPIYR